MDEPDKRAAALAMKMWEREKKKEVDKWAMDVLDMIPEWDDRKTYQYTEPEMDVTTLLDTRMSEPETGLEVERDPATGEILRFKEVVVEGERTGTAKTSLSLKRTPAPPGLGIKGSSTNSPFLPGGMEEEYMNAIKDSMENTDVDLGFDGELLSVPPGFKRGGRFSKKTAEDGDERPPTVGNSDAKETEVSGENSDEEEEEADDFLSLMDMIGGGMEKNLDLPKMPTKDQKKTSQAQNSMHEKLQSFNISGKEGEEEKDDEETKEDDFLAMMDTIGGADPSMEIGGSSDEEETGQETPLPPKKEPELNKEERETLENVLQAPLPKAQDGPPTKKYLPSKTEYVYAEKLDATKPVPDFQRKIGTMAKKYPFTLDPFQQQAVLCLERGESVFVAAHTSAGKTVVAEYAVALCKRHLTRAVYTSPIKALSNQKFREFKMSFGEVGLITGDMQLNPEAFCLIMTTEILRSMLYNGSEVTRELEWVIFDEVHYINDSERGVVWEEVLIMLPSHINIIMLSATVPNPLEFADWVGHIKKRKIFVISTLKRPVPLEHFLYTGTDGKTRENRFLIVDKDRNFLNHGYKLALESKKVGKKPQSGRGTGGYKQSGNWNNPKSDKNTWITVINHLESRDLLPTVAFTFSRKRCDENAAVLTTIDLTTAVEKREIHHFFSRCIATLKGSDKRLPQVTQMQDLCKRGMAVHHSGILPIMKEVVELLFQQGFVKVLFATETFAMGVNMPARTVVFDNMRKHDGKQNRDLTPGEYVQMAGRAGRRGLDTTGTVILLCKQVEIPEASDLAKMMLGTPVKLQSQFRVTYAMLLNLLRVEELRVEDMLQRSFAESSTLRKGLGRREELKSVETRLATRDNLKCKTCVDGGIADYYRKTRDLIQMEKRVWKKIFYLPTVSKMLDSPGRVAIVSRGRSMRNVPGVVLKSFRVEGGKKRLRILLPIKKTPDDIPRDPEEEERAEDRLRLWDAAVEKSEVSGVEGESGDHSVVDIPVENVVKVCSKTLKIHGNSILEDWDRRQQPRFRNSSPDRSVLMGVKELRHLGEVWRKSEGGPPFLEPGKDVQSSDVDLLTEIQDLKGLKASMAQFTCVHCLSFKEHFMEVQDLVSLEEKRDTLKYLLSPESLQTNAAYKDKLGVLKCMGYVDGNNMVELKGKVACEISQHELLVTELMLENVFSPLTPPEVAAVLSSMTCQFKTRDFQLNEHMKRLKGVVMGVVEKISGVQREWGVTDYDLSEELQFGLMEVVFEWGRGVPFAQLMEMTEAQEGLIVRCIQRLDEMCKDVRNAARIVGDPTLQLKMEETSQAIKRDIVFAASLYTTIT